MATSRPIAEALEGRTLLSGIYYIRDAPSVTEGDSGTRQLSFRIDWIGSFPDEPGAVIATTHDGTASAAEGDYDQQFAAVSFPVDNVEPRFRFFRVTVRSDMRDETNETVIVKLSMPGPAGIGDDTAVGIIIEDDDHLPTVSMLPIDPNVRETPVESVFLEFSEAVSGLDVSDFTLTRDEGPNLLTTVQSITPLSQTGVSLNGLTPLTGTRGTYVITLSGDSAATFITDGDNNPLVGGATRNWINTFDPPPPPPPVLPYGPEFRVNTFTTFNQKNPATAMDADGDFVIVWQSERQDDPPAAPYGIFGQRYDAAGVKQGAEFLVNTTIGGAQTKPAIAMAPAGNFIVAWESSDGTSSQGGIYAQRFNVAGVKQGSEFRVNTHTANQQANPSVAIDADGDFVIAWQSAGQDNPPTSSYGVYAQRFNFVGAPQGGEFRANAVTVDHQFYPTVAMDHAGNFVIAWQSHNQDPGGTAGVYAQRYTAAGVGQGEFRVHNELDYSQQFPSAAMDADGDFVIAFQSDGLRPGVWVRRFNAAGAAQGGQFRANTENSSYQNQPVVTMDADGDFAIAWQKDPTFPISGPVGIWGQRFNSAGAFVDAEFRVNTFLAGTTSLCAIAMDGDGDFVVAWASYGQDPGDNASTSGVYAQLYRARRPPRVTNVYARGTTWSAPFLSYLQAQGLGSAEYGFAIGGGAAQLTDLPWRNIDRVSLTFDQDVDLSQFAPAVRGVNVAVYFATDVVYNSNTRTVTWGLSRAIVNDKVRLRVAGVAGAGPGGESLDGEWTTGGSFPSGNGAAGGDFNYRFNVLPGNVNRTGNVLADDFSAVKARFFRSTTSPGTGANTYTIFHDVDGSGSILADDFSAVKARFFTSLPGPEPTGGPALRAGPPTRDLFSTAGVVG